jgi:hypothetical protein
MKSRFFTILLALSLGASAINAQPAEISRLQHAKKTAIERLNKFKECLMGKRPCTAGDFAAVTAGILFLYGMLRAGRTLLPQPEWAPLSSLAYGSYPAKGKEFAKRVPYYADPGHWGYKTVEYGYRGAKAAGKKIGFSKPKPKYTSVN